MNEPKNSANECCWTPTIALIVSTPMPTKQANVTFAPPTRSDSQPPNGRATEPISAPVNARPAR